MSVGMNIIYWILLRIDWILGKILNYEPSSFLRESDIPRIILSLSVVLSALLMACALVWKLSDEAYMLTPFDQRITTTGLEWVRIQDIEKFQTLGDVAHTTEVPSDAFNVKDLDNGWSGYDVNRW